MEKFKYLGRIMREDDDDTSTIIEQIKKARQSWNDIARILKPECVNAISMAKPYLAIVQSVLLYGADSWIINSRNWKHLKSFHKRAVRHMTRQHIQKYEN